MRPALATVLLLALAACASDSWIPVQTAPRPAVSDDHVAFLDAAPSRAFAVVGVISTQPGDYDSEASAVKGMRHEAAKHGADAIFIDSISQSHQQPVGLIGHILLGSGYAYRAKAIVWLP